MTTGPGLARPWLKWALAASSLRYHSQPVPRGPGQGLPCQSPVASHQSLTHHPSVARFVAVSPSRTNIPEGSFPHRLNVLCLPSSSWWRSGGSLHVGNEKQHRTTPNKGAESHRGTRRLCWLLLFSHPVRTADCRIRSDAS